MKAKLPKTVLFICMGISIILSACGAIAPSPTPTATATATKTSTPTFTPTVTPTPTKTPKPTVTPNLAATQQYDDFYLWVEKFFNADLIQSLNGELHPLQDYSNSLAKSGYYTSITYDGFVREKLILQANVKLTNSTTDNLSKSGCGFVFDYIQAIFFARDGNVNFRTAGTDRGSRYVDSVLYDDPNGVKITLLINNGLMHFFVNDQVGLSGVTVRKTPFSIGPAVLSGTSEGFGTRCDFTDIVLWEIK